MRNGREPREKRKSNGRGEEEEEEDGVLGEARKGGREEGGLGGVRGWRKQRDSDGAERQQGEVESGIGRKQRRQQQLPLSGRLAVIMRNKLPL